MAIRTVRLDEETEQTLKHVVERSGMNISTALKQGLELLNKELSGKASIAPYEILNQLDLGEAPWTSPMHPRSRQRHWLPPECAAHILTCLPLCFWRRQQRRRATLVLSGH